MPNEGVPSKISGLVTPSLRKAVLAICGGGNAAHTLAVVCSQNFDGDVVWLTGSAEKAERLRQGVFSEDGLRATGAVAARADRVTRVSSDPAEVIPDADVVIIAVPAFGHAPILSRISPHLKESALVGAIPARSGFEFDATRLVSGLQPDGRRAIFGLQTLPWSTRVQQPAKSVHVGVCKAQVLMATLPSNAAPDVALRLSDLLGIAVVATPSFLAMTLGNPGQVIHPGIMYGWFAGWSGATYGGEEIPLFYAGVSDETGAVVEALSAEASAVARAIEARSQGALDCSGVHSIHDWLRTSYPTETGDMTSVATCFRTGPLQARKVPVREVSPGQFVPDFRYRYLSEDVPYGLAVVKGMAELAGVDTPRIDAVVGWTQEKLGKRYLVDGKMTGADAGELRIPQNYGIHTLTELVEWYLQWSRVPAPPLRT
jgi:NAD/NADP octopine/nopaline dehydrogenase, alpha-helical domain